MNVVVTGGAGFIGANLCCELDRRPQIGQVIVIDDLSTGYADNLAGTGAKLIEGSILDRDLLDELIRGADAVVHLAARPSVPRSLVDPETSHDVNATGTVRVLEACRRASVHLIAASSSSVYGTVSQSPKREDDATRPLSPYGASKLATEAYVLAYGAASACPRWRCASSTCTGRCRPPGTRTPPSSRRSSTPRCAAAPCTSTATAARRATSPTSALSRESRLRRRHRQSRGAGPVRMTSCWVARVIAT